MKKRAYDRVGYLFILPVVILFAVFVVYPICYNIAVSFYDWNGIDLHREFAGLDNYIKLMRDPVMKRVTGNFLLIAFFTTAIQAFLGVIFASFFINKIPFSGLYRIMFYLPVIATPAVIGDVFSNILETNRGYLNVFLSSVQLGFLRRQWLADTRLALGCVIFVNIWQWTGYSMLMYYANLLTIPPSMYEAATLDGAGKLQQLRYLTLPLLRGTHYTLFILGVLGSLKFFDLSYVLTRGGPAHATETFSTYIYTKSFLLFRQGEASAIAVLMFLIALFITFVQLKLYYRNDKNKELADG